MSKANNFLAWLIEDINTVHAEVGTPRDAQLREFEAQGFLQHSDCLHGENTYAITNKGAVGYRDERP